MDKVRVLIVDDSVVVRRLLSNALADDPAIEVVGTAADGSIALAKIPQLRPDLAVVDVEMPVMNGLEFLVQLRKLHPTIIPIMFSSLTEDGAAATLDALALGARDYLTKPSRVSNLNESMDVIRRELVPRIKALCLRESTPATAPRESVAPKKTAPVAESALSPAERARNPISAVVIASSTGGPQALNALIPALPGELPVPVLIVQHMPKLFTGLLAQRLNQVARMAVAEGQAGVQVMPGQVWLAPGDFHMIVTGSRGRPTIALNQEPPQNYCRPAADVLFQSAASVFGANTLAVVLTGMGRDGALGAERIRQAGGTVYAQDEASSVVWGMPGSVVQAGQADQVFPLVEMAQAITRRVHSVARHSG